MRVSRLWVTTTNPSTAGAVPRWTTCASCQWIFRNSSSSNLSKTTAPPVPSCVQPTTSSSLTPSYFLKRCSQNWGRANRCGWSMPITRSMKQSVWCRVSSPCGPAPPWRAVEPCESGKTLPCCTAPTIRHVSSSKLFAKPTSLTKCPGGKVFLTAQKFVICVPGCA